MASIPVVARSRFPVWLMAALLGLVTIALYWPVTSHDFINYDDNLYVTSNVHVQNGLTLESLKWAFFNPVNSSWQPLTLLSHMLDCQLFGLKPWGHHLTSVLLHAVNTVLVLLLLRRLTGACWRSLLAAALFGLHPLHVESVAWVAERKNVLSTCFGLLALLFYVRYAQAMIEKNREQNRQVFSSPLSAFTSGSYWLVFFFFLLGLLSKPMLVTWPFVMLLLDYWPLERNKSSRAWLLVTEKIPFFALASVASVVTFMVQKHEGALGAGENLPLGARSENALISYCRYLGKMLWPTDFAVFYPHPGYWPREEVFLAGLLIFGISVLLFVKRGQYPFLLIGWLWYCGTLVPVIQLVQTGAHAMADRYAYIPSLGILILAVWGAYELIRRRQYGVIALSVAGAAAIVMCLALTRQQIGYWKDSETLFRHALEVTENNHVAHHNLGTALGNRGQTDEAIRHFQEAIRLKPDYANAHYNLGIALSMRGQNDEAISQFQEAVRLKPDYTEAYYNLGTALGKKGRMDEAISNFQEAIRLKPDYTEAHYNLGTALGRKGQMDEAISQFQEAIRLKPDAEAHNSLGLALLREGRVDEAGDHFQKAVEIDPGCLEARHNLGAVLLRQGQVDQAIVCFEKVVQIHPDHAEAHYNLGVALLRKGQVDQAIVQLCKALEIRPTFAEAEYSLGNGFVRKGEAVEAVACFEKALENRPDFAEAQNNLAWVLATWPAAAIRNGARAVQLAEKADLLSESKNPAFKGTLAAAYAEAGRFSEAVATAQRALGLAKAQTNNALIEALEPQIGLYQAGLPVRDPAQTNSSLNTPR
jgi:protein O-mannosyl-transferase